MKIYVLYLNRDVRLTSFKVGSFNICILVPLFLPGLKVCFKLSNYCIVFSCFYIIKSFSSKVF
jgi:hypothetical protein